MKVLVTGGAGYVGSHMVLELLDRRIEPVVFDNLSTGRREFVPEGVELIEGDLKDPAAIDAGLRRHPVEAVLHFAASSIVAESMRDPFQYYENNVLSFLHLLGAMRRRGVNKLILSSTAAIYGNPEHLPIREQEPAAPTNIYGESKLMIERILKDVAATGQLSYASLRYFNACGAREGAGIGEWHDPETHLIPNVFQAACGQKEELMIYGGDYPTADGTCVRDYVHVQDLCRAHLLALEGLASGVRNEVFNLGSGQGTTVKQLVDRAERVSGRPVRVRIAPRRPGDPPALVASYEKARRVLGWEPKADLDGILRSAWSWEAERQRRTAPAAPLRAR